MDVGLMAIWSLITYMYAPGAWAYERKIWRPPLMIDRTSAWTTYCRSAEGASCETFVSCCKQFPNVTGCTNSGGIMEHPICNYWAGRQFDPEEHGNCGCFQKFIKVDYKSQCQGEEEQNDCDVFSGCCKDADNDECVRYFAGELEYPACNFLLDKHFDYNEAVCRCAIDSSNATLKSNFHDTGPPSSTLLSTSGGNKDDSVWTAMVVTLTAAIIHHCYQPGMGW